MQQIFLGGLAFLLVKDCGIKLCHICVYVLYAFCGGAGGVICNAVLGRWEVDYVLFATEYIHSHIPSSLQQQ